MRLLTTRQLAEALGVSESSLKRWVDAGKIAASRTEGGHRRIELGEAMRFIRSSGTPLVRPEVLDLPEVALGRERDRLIGYLLSGDGVGARGWLMGRYLEGSTIAELADGPIREAMHELGELWRHDEAGIFIEHRGTDICLQAIAQLRSMTDAPSAQAPVALGGGPPGDPYLLPSQLAAMSLAELGMRAINLGPDTPASAFEAAISEHAPRMVWLSITTVLAPARARSIARMLASLPSSITIAIGGQQASTLGNLPARVKRVASMSALAEVGASVVKRERAS